MDVNDVSEVVRIGNGRVGGDGPADVARSRYAGQPRAIAHKGRGVHRAGEKGGRLAIADADDAGIAKYPWVPDVDVVAATGEIGTGRGAQRDVEVPSAVFEGTMAHGGVVDAHDVGG